MTSLRRYRIAIRCLALVAIMTMAATLAWVSPSRGHLGPVAFSIGSAILLLWSVTDAPLCCLEAVEQVRFYRCPKAPIPRGRRDSSVSRSRFLGPVVRKWFEAGKEAASEVSSPASPFVGKNVLIADDDFEITQTLSMRFERLGMTALRTSDALQLLFGVHKVKADLVVVDVNMPTGNGLALCELLNSDKTFARLPVIVYTGSSAEETVRRCRALGAIMSSRLRTPGPRSKRFFTICSRRTSPMKKLPCRRTNQPSRNHGSGRQRGSHVESRSPLLLPPLALPSAAEPRSTGRQATDSSATPQNEPVPSRMAAGRRMPGRGESIACWPFSLSPTCWPCS